jgi:hypothetical protein
MTPAELKLNINRGYNTLVVLLISADILLIILYIVHSFSGYTGFLQSQWFSFQDRGFAESYTYVKEYWIVLLLFVLCVKKSRWIYALWALFYGYILIDDSFRLHETLGRMVSTNFSFAPMMGLRPGDLGELIVYVCVGLVFLIPIGVAYYRSDRETKLNTRVFLVILAFLVFCGVVLDIACNMVKGGKVLNVIGGILENGGEMIAVSAMLLFVFCLTTNEGCRSDIFNSLENVANFKLIRHIQRFTCGS